MIGSKYSKQFTKGMSLHRVNILYEFEFGIHHLMTTHELYH